MSNYYPNEFLPETPELGNPATRNFFRNNLPFEETNDNNSPENVTAKFGKTEQFNPDKLFEVLKFWTDNYGKNFLIRILTDRVFHISDPIIAKEVLLKRPKQRHFVEQIYMICLRKKLDYQIVYFLQIIQLGVKLDD